MCCLSLLDTVAFCDVSPSMIAAASLCIARKYYETKILWSQELQNHTGYTYIDMQPVLYELCGTFNLYFNFILRYITFWHCTYFLICIFSSYTHTQWNGTIVNIIELLIPILIVTFAKDMQGILKAMSPLLNQFIQISLVSRGIILIRTRK